jgi:hypothetical protein
MKKVKIEKHDHFKIGHSDLLLIERLICKPSGWVVQNLKAEEESADYGAAEFTIGTRLIKLRVAKITPTKVGQFVTFWKRIGKGPIQPYDCSDPFDLLIISVRAENHFGQFIFPKRVLCEKGIVSMGEKEGKRAMRVYPPWDKADNSQAKKTQAWQLEWFIEIPEKLAVDVPDNENQNKKLHKIMNFFAM